MSKASAVFDVSPKYFYDGVQIFTCRDDFGVNYLFTLVEQASEGPDKYLGVKLPLEKYYSVLHGKTDLREIYTSSDEGSFAIIMGDSFDLGESLSMEIIEKKQITEAWLPLPGFFLASETSKKMQEAKDKNAVLISFGIEAPEAKKELKIPVEKLVEGLQAFDSLFKSMVLNKIKQLSKEAKDMWRTTSFGFDVYNIAHASFRLDMKSHEPLDILHESKTEMILKDVSKFLNQITDLDEVNLKNFIRSNYTGSVTYSLFKMSKYVLNADSPVYVEWVSPTNIEKKQVLDKKLAALVYENFSSEEMEDREKIEFTGEVSKIDDDNKSWTLILNRDKKTFKVRGKVDPKKGISFSGLTIGKIYKFKCERIRKYNFKTGKNSEETFLIAQPKSVEQ